MSFSADLTACAAIVEKGDPDRFAAAMASPVAVRRVLFPLYAFNVEVSRAPWVTQEPMIAEMRLQWWRDALEEIAEAKPVRRHEVVTPLSEILDPEAARCLDLSVAARRWDIYKDPFEDEAHFDQYLDHTAGGLMWVAARSLSGGQPLPDGPLRALGRATGLARYLQAVPALEAQGRVPLVDGRGAAIVKRAQQALHDCPSRRGIRRSLPPQARGAVTEAFLTKPVLNQVVKHPDRVGAGTLMVNPLVRSLVLWQWS